MARYMAFAGFILFCSFAIAPLANELTFDGLSNSNPAPSFDNGYVVGWDQTGMVFETSPKQLRWI
jgi:hypothetical protein